MTPTDLESAMIEFQRAVEARDVTAAGAVLDEDYALMLVHPVPAVMPRERWLATLPDYVVSEWTVSEQVVDVDGDLAAVLQTGMQRAVVLGSPRDGAFVISDVWRRVGGHWRLWRRHSTPLSAGEMPRPGGDR
jgi:ketosteroid isomerase-like protein